MTSARSQDQVEAVESRLPYVEKSLLEYLSKLYPDKAPEPDDTDREIWMNRGAVGVVRHLNRLYIEQNENLLGNIDDVFG